MAEIEVVHAVGIWDPSFITYSVHEHAQRVDAGDSEVVVHLAVSANGMEESHGFHVIIDITTRRFNKWRKDNR